MVLLEKGLDEIFFPDEVAKFHQEISSLALKLVSKITFKAVVQDVEKVSECFKVISQVQLGTKLFFLSHNLLRLVGLLQLIQGIQNMQHFFRATQVSIDLMGQKRIVTIRLL